MGSTVFSSRPSGADTWTTADVNPRVTIQAPTGRSGPAERFSAHIVTCATISTTTTSTMAAFCPSSRMASRGAITSASSASAAAPWRGQIPAPDMSTEPNEHEENQSLRRGINDLASVMSLGAKWAGGEAALVARTLLDVLVPMLDLDFAYVRLSEPAGQSFQAWARFGNGCSQNIGPEELGKALQPHLVGDSRATGCRIPSPLGEGTISIVVLRLGLSDTSGRFAAGSQRDGFPTNIEKLVLQVATNQAAIALQEADRLADLRRSVEELDRRVEERTAQLTAAHESFREESLRRERGERALTETEDRLRQMAESIPEVIWIATLEPEEKVVYTSSSFERVWGLPLETLYRNPRLWVEAIHPEDRPRVVREYSRWIG